MPKDSQYIKCLDITKTGIADCVHCAIRKNTLFAHIEIKKHKDKLKKIFQFHYPKRSTLFNKADLAKDVFIIRKGLVKIEEVFEDGNSRIVRLINSGCVAGIETFLDNDQHYDHTAIALQDTEVCRIPYSVLMKVRNEDPPFFVDVVNEWHENVKESDRVIISFSTGTLKQRVSRILIMLIDQANQEKHNEIEMLCNDDIAALAGVTKESVSRVISDFKRKKLIIKSSPHKMIFNESALKELSSQQYK